MISSRRAALRAGNSACVPLGATLRAYDDLLTCALEHVAPRWRRVFTRAFIKAAKHAAKRAERSVSVSSKYGMP